MCHSIGANVIKIQTKERPCCRKCRLFVQITFSMNYRYQFALTNWGPAELEVFISNLRVNRCHPALLCFSIFNGSREKPTHSWHSTLTSVYSQTTSSGQPAPISLRRHLRFEAFFFWTEFQYKADSMILQCRQGRRLKSDPSVSVCRPETSLEQMYFSILSPRGWEAGERGVVGIK